MDKDIKNEFEKMDGRMTDILSAINKFAGSVDERFNKIESEMATKAELGELRKVVDRIDERTLTEIEKGSLLDMADDYNKQLEKNTLGRVISR